jgi:hypothetical protein
MMAPPLRLAVVLSLVALGVSTAAAQSHIDEPPQPVDARPGFLTRYDFHLNAARLSSSDPRFSWDADFGGDLDVVDYGKGRLNLLANYEAVIGRQLKPIDPNQGNYTLDALSTARWGSLELGAALHHVSRHLSDRSKSFSIDWNTVEGRVRFYNRRGNWEGEADGHVGTVIRRSFVDYAWEAGWALTAARSLGGGVTAILRSGVDVLGTDKAVSNRTNQVGTRVELALRSVGTRAAVEFFVTGERRPDADALERLPQTWLSAGFRLLNR